MTQSRSIVLIVVALSVGFGLRPAAQEKPVDPNVQKVVDAFTAALNKGDGKAAAALFTQDGDYVSSTGRTAQGSAEIEKLVADQANAAFKGMTFVVKTTRTRSVTPDVVIGSGTFEASGPKPRRGMTTMVLVRQGGEWKIAALRAMVPAPLS